MTKQSFQYQESFQYTEVTLKGERKYYIEGYIATSDPDSVNEVLTQSALKSIVDQCLNRPITLDVEHEEWYDSNGKQQQKPLLSRIPVAKIVDAQLKGNGVWAKCEINQNSERFEQIWGSIKGQFLHSFSVAFYPMKAITKSVGDKVLRFIDDLSLVNVTLTGSPINVNATFVPVMKAALKSIHEENTMTEELKSEVVAPAVEAPVVKAEVPTAPAIEQVSAPVIDEVSTLKAEIAALKAQLEKSNEKTDIKTEEAPALKAESAQHVVESNQEFAAQLKSLQEEVASLKAELVAPVIKGLGPETKVEALANIKSEPTAKSVFDFIK